MKKKILFTLISVLLPLSLWAEEAHWQCNPADFQYDMTVYVSLINGNSTLTDLSDYEIAAFCGSECRGVVSDDDVLEAGSIQIGYLRVRSNKSSGEVITFKVYDKNEDAEIRITNSKVTFSSNATQGTPSSPLGLNITNGATLFEVTVVSSDEAQGAVTGGGAVMANTPVTVKATPTMGFDFVAWMEDDVQVSTDSEYTFTPDKDVTLKATFSAHIYKATFVSEGMSEEQEIAFGEVVTPPAPASKTGYTFSAWDNVPETMPAADITVTALYTINSYKLIFVVDNEHIESDIEYASDITKPEDPAKEGYTFTGWTPEVPATMPAEDVTYTATWSINQYTVRFVADSIDVYNQKQDYQSAIVVPEDPVKEGYTFKGWTPEVAASVPAEDVTYTAVFEINTYKLTFVVDNERTESNIEYASDITKPEDPAKDGYTFTGWTPKVPATMPAEDVTYTATWSINQYTVRFVFAGKVIVEQRLDYQTAIVAPENPENTGYTFVGWGDVDATMPAYDVTFEAQYTVNIYKITYTIEGQEDKVFEVQYLDSVPTINDPELEGHTFVGWDKEIPVTMPAEDVTITAIFDVNVYAIRYYIEEEIWAEDSLEYGAPIELRKYELEDTSRYSYEWLGEKFKTMPAHDLMYTLSIADNISNVRVEHATDVFNLNGTKKRSKATAKDIRDLPPGMYIIRGQKVLIQ